MDKYIAKYNRDGFLITISSIKEIVNENSLEIDFQNIEHLAIFTHEYWHSLLHLSTISRIRDFIVYLTQISIFSKTLTSEADGTSEGDKILSESELFFLEESLEYLLAQVGGVQTESIFDYDNFEIKVEPIVPENYVGPKLFGKDVPISTLEAKLSLLKNGNEIDNVIYYIGILSIEESIANSIEILVNNKTKNKGFRYNILIKLFEFYELDSSDHHLIASLGTLSLLTTDPPSGILNLIKDYKNLIANKKNKEEALDIIKRNITDLMSQYKDFLSIEIESLKEIYKNREPLNTAIKVVAEDILSLYKRRLSNPTFDTDCFLNGKLNSKKYSELTNEIFKPVLLLQKRKESESSASETLISMSSDCFNIENIGNYTKGSLFKILSLLEHFYKSHYTIGIMKSEFAQEKCIYYNSCEAQGRVEKPEICKSKPWELLKTKFDDCEYCQMASCLIGETKKRN